MSDSLRPHGLYPTRLLRPWNFPGKSTEVGCHFLLQGIFPTQGSNLGLLHLRQTLYHLSHQEAVIMKYYLALKKKKKEGNGAICNKMDEPKGHYAKSKWPVTEGEMCMTPLM